MLDARIAELMRRLPGVDATYAFVLSSRATTTVSFYAVPDTQEDTAAAVLAQTLPAHNRALGGQALARVN